MRGKEDERREGLSYTSGLLKLVEMHRAKDEGKRDTKGIDRVKIE